MGQASDVQNMYRSRMRSETEATSAVSTQNRLLASSLTELLEARKSVTDRAALETLATRYHMDVATLERLSRCVNTPSVDESTVVRTTDKHGEESLTMMVSRLSLNADTTLAQCCESGSLGRSRALPRIETKVLKYKHDEYTR